jgi:hypothetical protein
MTMLVAYFDESGTHGREAKVTTVAGLVGDSIEWARLELPWRTRLGGISCFHATDCASTERHFRHLSRPEANLLAQDLASLIAQRKLVSIGASVYRDDWDYGASEKLKAQFHTPYHLCVTLAIMQACKASANHDPVAFVFAKQNEYEAYARTIHSVIEENSADHSAIGSLTFASPQCVIPLQAGDLYAYETYKELLTQLATPGLTAPARSPMKIICEALGARNVIANIEYLHKCSDGLDLL